MQRRAWRPILQSPTCSPDLFKGVPIPPFPFPVSKGPIPSIIPLESRVPRDQSAFGFSAYRRIGEASNPGPAPLGKKTLIISSVNLTGYLKRVEDLNSICSQAHVVCCQESGLTSSCFADAKALTSEVGWNKLVCGPLGPPLVRNAPLRDAFLRAFPFPPMGEGSSSSSSS